MSFVNLNLMVLFYVPHFLTVLMVASLIILLRNVYVFERHLNDIQNVLSSTFGEDSSHASAFGGLNHMLQTSLRGIFGHARLLETCNVQLVVFSMLQALTSLLLGHKLILISSSVGFASAFFVYVFTHKNIERLRRYERLMGKSPVEEEKDGQ